MCPLFMARRMARLPAWSTASEEVSPVVHFCYLSGAAQRSPHLCSSHLLAISPRKTSWKTSVLVRVVAV